MEEEVIEDNRPKCPHCGSRNCYGMSRVVGYFSKIDNWNAGKRAEFEHRQAGDYKLSSSRIEELGQKKIVHNNVMVVCLFETQKILWERLISGEKEARSFEIILFRAFKLLTGIDPIPQIKKITDYITKVGRSGEVQYLGSNICRELGEDYLSLAMEINSVWASILQFKFPSMLIKAWEMPTAQIRSHLADPKVLDEI